MRVVVYAGWYTHTECTEAIGVAVWLESFHFDKIERVLPPCDSVLKFWFFPASGIDRWIGNGLALQFNVAGDVDEYSDPLPISLNARLAHVFSVRTGPTRTSLHSPMGGDGLMTTLRSR